MIIDTTETILIIAAVVPALVLLRYIYRQDKLEKESGKFLASLVLFGILSTFIAIAGEYIGTAAIQYIVAPGSKAYYLLFFFVVVGLSEEGAKYFLLKKKTWNSPEFNCQFDGVVYAVFVSLGFALWENLSYVFSYGIGTAVSRAITAIPGHACFGVFSGAFYGAAKRMDLSGNTSGSKTFRRLSLIVPMLLHGLYDYIAMGDNDSYVWVFILFVAVLFYSSFRIVKVLSKNDVYIQ